MLLEFRKDENFILNRECLIRNLYKKFEKGGVKNGRINWDKNLVDSFNCK